MQIIYIESTAPQKPVWGAQCNGCGLCCLSEPCPLGMVLSRKRQGSCIALRWNESAQVYRCGAITDPGNVLKSAMPWALGWVVPALAWVVSKLAHRWIAAGIGCDSNLESVVPRFDDNAT